jgi:hypothetical protein
VAILCHDYNILLLAGPSPPEISAEVSSRLWRWRGGGEAALRLAFWRKITQKLWYLKRSTSENIANKKRDQSVELFGPKEVLKDVQNWPYSAHDFYQPWQMRIQIMIGDGRES